MGFKYVLFLDDERTIEQVDRTCWPEGLSIIVARSSVESIRLVKELRGDIAFLALDHDLGGDDDTAMNFLRWYASSFYHTTIPEYYVHSENPNGRDNIIAFIESWKRSQELP